MIFELEHLFKKCLVEKMEQSVSSSRIGKPIAVGHSRSFLAEQLCLSLLTNEQCHSLHYLLN